MLTSRQAILEQRDRINKKGNDGGSYIPRAVSITGKTAGSSATTIISLPRYINIKNLIHAKFIINTDTTNLWLINDIGTIFTDATCDYNDDPTITHDANPSIVAGLAVSGTGIPSGAYIASITDTTHFELSASTTGGSVTNGTLTFTDAFSVEYNSDDNTIKVGLLDAGHQGVDFILTVFYNG